MSFGNFYGPGFPFMPFMPPNTNDDKTTHLRMSVLPFILDIKEGRIPTIPALSSVANIKWFVTDFKDQGNEFFKQKNYNGANEMYTVALNLCRHLQDYQYVPVDNELLSVLFSNRAFCLLKMDYFKESIIDCDIALQQNKANFKAYYRKALALKYLRDYPTALKSATEGRECAIKLGKMREAQDIDEVIREIKSHLPEETASAAVKSSKSASETSSTKSESAGKVQVAAAAAKKIPSKADDSGQSKKSKKAEAGATKVGLGSDGSANNTNKGKKEKETKKSADQSWLEGTNAKVSSKAPVVARQQKKKSASNLANESKSAKSAYSGRFATLPSDDDGDETYSDDSSSQDDSEVTHSKQLQDMGLEDFSTPGGELRGKALQTQHKSSNSFVEPAPKPLAMSKSVSETRSTVTKLPPSLPSSEPAGTPTKSSSTQSTSAIKTDTHQIFQSASWDSIVQASELELARAPHDDVERSGQFGYFNFVSKSSMLPQQIIPQVATPPSKHDALQYQKSAPSTHKELLAGELVPMQSRQRLPYPFDIKYDFTLVCNVCYPQRHDGHSGFVALVYLPHHCERNHLVVRQKNNTDAHWAKIRPRNTKYVFLGQYKLCRDFIAENPCKQIPCSFAHYEEEIHLWTLDREGQFSLEGFVIEQQQYLANDIVRSMPSQSQRTTGVVHVPNQLQRPTNTYAPAQPWQTGPVVQQPSAKLGFEDVRASNYADKSNEGMAFVSPRYAGQPNVAAGLNLPHYSSAYNPMAQSLGSDGVMTFPLSPDFSYKLVCEECLILSSDGRFGSYNLMMPVNHLCSESILAVKHLVGDEWHKIRELRNHRPFRGGFRLCNQYAAGQVCTYYDRCMFPHSVAEQQLWTLEKDGKFSVVQFILENRNVNTVPLYDVRMLLSENSGEFGYLCLECFQIDQLISIQNSLYPSVCGRALHDWFQSRILIHFSMDGTITLIGKRVHTSKNAFYRLCRYQQFCSRRWNNACHFAHSVIERNVWCVERDHDMTQDDIVQEANRLLQLQISKDSSQMQNITVPASVHHHSPASSPSLPIPTTSAAPATQAQPQSVRSQPLQPQPARPAVSVGPKVANVPNVVAVCSLCFSKGTLSRQGTGKMSERCSTSGVTHPWETNKIYVLLPSKKRVNQLPKRIPTNSNFAICKHMILKRHCDWVNGGCQFAHSQEEIDLWKWMVMQNVKTLEEIVAMNQKPVQESPAPGVTSAPAPWKAIPRGQSVIEVKPTETAGRHASLFSVHANTHYCQYCSVHCNSQKQWDEHCASEKHTFNVNSDREHQWNYRQPPWGVGGADYEICKLHEDGARCKFSDVPDMYNQCKFAHSREELDEWLERWEWRQMKRDMAKSQHLYSYMEQLRDEYESTSSGISVLTEELDGVKITCSSNLHIYEEKKDAIHTWEFEIHAKDKVLERVALLHDRDRLHFVLRGADLDRVCQIAQGEAFVQRVKEKACNYKVQVAFVGGMFGSFSQWVVFDFGQRPVLVRKVNVELGAAVVQEKVRSLRDKLKFDRWTSDNRKVIWMDTNKQAIEGDLNTELMHRYKAPSSSSSVITQEFIGIELNRHNYRHKMHKLLQLEELTQAKIISRYNLKTEVTLTSIIDERSGMVHARPGELFARLPLSDQLNDDTDAGRLILSGVTCVLLAPQHGASQTVYEAVFVQLDNFNYNGRGSDYVYLCLSPRCCAELQLESGMDVEVEIQFQMNRLPVCLMHYAIDQLADVDLVFPDVSKMNHSWSEKSSLQLSSSVLNECQIKIIEYIVAERQGYTAPLIVYGPFGTGKTETLAQAAMLLATRKMGARILICTRSNSAADVYILRHFDELRKSLGGQIKVLRVVATDRRMNTISPVVQRYCLISSDGKRILAPTKDNILEHEIILTTLVTSLVLTKLDVRGQFTHIFVDEAAQVLECEAIMPLCLADEFTRVVLAGDHYQMSQKVYSGEARRQKFHMSLVERMYLHYKTYAPIVGRHLPNILLSSNYRTKMELVRFLAAAFYGGPDALHSLSNLPDVRDIVPLTFYTAQGREIQDKESTSYYNLAEVEEIVERVSTLVLCWPEEWIEPNASAAESILVVTPYLDQVTKIRSALRKKGKELKVDLGRVNVERVSNIQGTEYHVVFLSTVRTRHLVEEQPRMLYSGAQECDGEYGDFGFLSDAKLLNTALTRARFMVAIVGDPVGLCAIGDCAFIWRAFLKHCQFLNSISPSYITLESLKSRVRDLMTSPYAVNVQIISKFNENAASGNYQLTQESESTDVGDVEQDFRDLVIEPSPFEAVTMKGVFQDWNLDYKIEPDSIIEQLAKEARKNAERQIEKTRAGTSGKSSATKSEDPLKLTCVHVRNGHAVIDYDSELKQSKREGSSQPRRRKVVGGNSDNEYDSDSCSSDTDGYSDQFGVLYVDYIPKHLHSLLQQQPDRYKRAKVVIENSSNMYVKCLDDSSIGKVKLGSRYRCGRAFNNDEVVVELLPIDAEDFLAIRNEERDTVHGQVIGILKRAINPKYRMFICTVDTENTGVMIPINRSIPKIYNLETKDLSMKSRKGHVCVYTFTRTLEVVFHHYEPVDINDPTAKLFIVRYLKWDANCFSPLGIVVGVMPNGATTESAMNVLSIEHYVPEKFKDDTLDELERLYPDWYEIPASVFNDRTDYRDQLTFTIDPEDSTDLDDAISVEELPNNCFLIGVHIADVGYFVRKGSSVDQEAQSRGATLYPVGRSPIPMLPSRLSSTLCSLLPGQDRLTVSVFITIDSKADVQRVVVKRCVIRSYHRLTYKAVEQALKGNEHVLLGESLSESEKLQMDLLMLSRTARMWRHRRLGTRGMFYPTNSVDDAPEAHLLVEELMITVNHHIALLLVERVPKCTPLRTQLRPNEADLDDWRACFRSEAKNTVALTSAFKRQGEVCNCIMECTCIPSEEISDSPVLIEKSVWQKMTEAALEWNRDKLQSLVLDPENHPKLVVAVRSLQSIQHKSAYVCSAELSDFTETYHNSLNISYYTTFTSPIRRYTDLVIGRLVVDCLVEQKPCPYSQADIVDVCYRSNDVLDKACKYELAMRIVHTSRYFRDRPVNFLAVVDNLTELSLDLCFLADHSCIPSRIRVTLASLGLSDMPLVTQNGSVVLKWAQRLYDLKLTGGSTSSIANGMERLNPNRFVYQTYASAWRNLVYSVISDNSESTIAAVVDVNSYLVDLSTDDRYAVDVTSEGSCVGSGQQIVNFSIELQRASIVQVQVSSDIQNGLCAPHLQLFNLTPTLDICLEHRTKISCFANTSLRMAARQTYVDVAHYQSCWLPIMALEAAKQAVGNNGGASVIIHNVPITWRMQDVSGTCIPTGTCEIPVKFARERNIVISKSLDEDEDDDENNINSMAATVENCCYGYMCVRHAGYITDAPEGLLDSKLQRKIEEVSSPSTWVGHCNVTRIKVSKQPQVYKLTLRLYQSSTTFPQQLLDEASQTATVEWIPKALPDRRAEEAVYNLESASQLARDIALGKNSQIVLDKAYVDVATEIASREVHGAYPLNSMQREAVEKAVKRPFTLIQGPPGTGKTALVARLAYVFSIINDSFSADDNSKGIRQVMVCGPSNKSVDVITGYLKNLKTLCPRIVRVYSEQIEQADYPLPSSRASATRSTEGSAEDLRDVSLHHMIRAASGVFGSSSNHRDLIRHIDCRIKSQETSIGPEEVNVFRAAIRLTEKEILSRSQIILCTCSASVMSKIQISTSVYQLIIDESGMCTEPESLIPIVSTGASQVVLVGDHMQLQPIVTEHTAKQRGLVRSLFERYADKAVSLTTQYRMHEAIAAFPSKQFYKGELSIGKEEQSKNSRLKFWPNGSNKPIEFVHVVGCEQSVSVSSTSEGNEQSKFNASEADVVVRAVRLLIRQSHVMPNEVAVLSQYRAQCSLIEKELLKKGEKDVTVSTVVSAQGSEWDYVILSTVRSLPKCQVENNPTTGWKYRHLGFIVDTHQINVALTRAKKGIIIVGNKYLLQCDKMWKKLLTHYADNKKIVDASQFAA